MCPGYRQCVLDTGSISDSLLQAVYFYCTVDTLSSGACPVIKGMCPGYSTGNLVLHAGSVPWIQTLCPGK